jgi:pyochelin biosynthetic protein PchC
MIDDLALLADVIHEALGGLDEKPTALFGHSMGALLAFEVARRMAAGGTKPLALFASSRRAPTTSRPEPLDLSDEALIASMTRLGGTNPALLKSEESLQPILRVMRNDYRAIEGYRYSPGPKLDCPIVALIGEQDAQVTVAEASRWEPETNSGFTLRTFPGGHFYLPDSCVEVAETITGVLGNSEAKSRA